MPTRAVLSPAQRIPFTAPPELSERDMVRYHTLTAEDLSVIAQRRRPHKQLGFSVQLCYLRYPGRPLHAEEHVPPTLLAFVATQLHLDPALMADDATDRATTRREHLLLLQQTFGSRPFDAHVYRELATWLLPTALSTDNGLALVTALIEELRSRRIG